MDAAQLSLVVLLLQQWYGKDIPETVGKWQIHGKREQRARSKRRTTDI
jgi:hypothetical protein